MRLAADVMGRHPQLAFQPICFGEPAAAASDLEVIDQRAAGPVTHQERPSLVVIALARALHDLLHDLDTAGAGVFDNLLDVEPHGCLGANCAIPEQVHNRPRPHGDNVLVLGPALERGDDAERVERRDDDALPCALG